MARPKNRAPRTQAQTSAPAAPASNAAATQTAIPNMVKVVDGHPLDAEGFVLLPKGQRDKRYQHPYGQAPTRERGTGTPGQTRQQSMTNLLSGKPWEFVREGFDPNGVKSVTGAKLKRFYVLRDTSTNTEVTVGRGEMIKYAGVTPPSKRGQKTKNDEQFDGAFKDGQTPEGEAADESNSDMSFLDEEPAKT